MLPPPPDRIALYRIYTVVTVLGPFILGFVRKAHSLSRSTLKVPSLLGAHVREGQLARHWKQAELGDRIGVSPDTVTKVERGEPSVALGLALGAARLVGVPLFSEETSTFDWIRDLTAARLALLPGRAKNPRSDE